MQHSCKNVPLGDVPEDLHDALRVRALEERDRAIAAAESAYLAQARLLGVEAKARSEVTIGHAFDSLDELMVDNAVVAFIQSASSSFTFFQVVDGAGASGNTGRRRLVARSIARRVIRGDLEQVQRGGGGRPAVYAKRLK